MFNFFKKSPTATEAPLEAVITKQVPFAMRLIGEHDTLLKAASKPSKAVFEMFLFNLWICYHTIEQALCFELSISTDADREAIRKDLRSSLAVDANTRGVSELRRHYSLRVAEYCPKAFDLYVEHALADYDRDVASREGPIWHSAAVKLGVQSTVPPEVFIEDSRGEGKILKDAYRVFRIIEHTGGEDVREYLTQRHWLDATHPNLL